MEREGQLKDVSIKIWKYVCELKQSIIGRVIYYNKTRELELFDLLIETVPKARESCSINDFADFARSSAFRNLSYKVFQARFSEFLQLKVYEFYFEVGRMSSFPIGYQLGQGTLHRYSCIPADVRKHFEAMGSSDVPPKNYDDSSWFIHIAQKAFGQHKAIQNAIKAANQCFSIYRLTYLRSSNVYFPERISSPFRYVGRDHNQILSMGYNFDDSGFKRIKSLDKIISELGKLAVKHDRSEIENRIINALDFLSLIEDVAPLRMKFLLCIFALEGLLLSGEDKQYGLRKKLSEKITFLILQPRDLTSVASYLYMDKQTPIPKTLIEARMVTAGKLERMYDKRSSFAHPRTRGADEISVSDFDFAMRVLRLAILGLNKLSRKGITHVRKKGALLDDMKSLDVYIERLKYS